MSLAASLRPSRSRLLAALLSAGLLAGSLAPGITRAALSACRTDPVLWINLSPQNDYKLQVSAAVATDSADVQSIQYVVHAPAGTSLSSVGYTGGRFKGKESVQFIADNAAGTFDVTTTVTTDTHGNSVTVTQSVSHPGFGSAKVTAEARGSDGQDIPTHVVQS